MMKRIISFLLVVLIISSAFTIVPSAEELTLTEYQVPVVSTECAYGTCPVFVDANGRLYISIDYITSYTRSTYIENDCVVTVRHGVRELVLDFEKQTLTENGKSMSLGMLYYNGLHLVHAAPILTYLGATCDISDGRLVIAMPSYTLWESIVATGYEKFIKSEDAFGSELNIKTRLLLNGILKMLDSGVATAVNAEYRSVLLALQVNVADYDKYFDEKASTDMKNAALLESMTNEGDALADIADFFGDVKTVHKIISIFNDPVGIFLADELKAANHSFIGGMGSTALATISSVSESVKASKDSFDIVSAAVRHLPTNARFYNNLSYAQSNLKSTESSVISSLSHHVILEEILKNNGVDVIAKMINDNYASSISPIYFSDIGKSVKPTLTQMIEASIKVSLLLNKAFFGADEVIATTTAETHVIELLRLRDELDSAVDTLGKKIVAEEYSNATDLEDFRLLRVFYYRTLIALNEQFEAMILAQNNKANNPEMQKLIADLRDQSNLFSKKLYMLTVTDCNAVAELSAICASNSWDGKIESTVPDALPDGDDDVGEILPPENSKSFWTFDYSDENPSLMRVYCDDDSKIQLIEKYPLYHHEAILEQTYKIQSSRKMTGSDVFGTVSEKYVFKYNGDKLDRVIYYHASESHLGVREFKEGYVMRFGELDTLSQSIKAEIYVNNMPTKSYDLFEFDDSSVTRTVYNYSIRTQRIVYSLDGRPLYSYVGIGENSNIKNMSYDEYGNIKAASINYRGNPFDIIEEYGFSFENDRLVDIRYADYSNMYQQGEKSYTATLSYNSDGLFSEADIRYLGVEQQVYKLNYDESGRVIKTELDTVDVFTLAFLYEYGENGKFKKARFSANLEYSNQQTSADYTFTYDGAGNLTQMSYPYFYNSSTFEMRSVSLSYSPGGSLTNDGVYEYEYYSTGELMRKSKIGEQWYTVYYKNGLKKEEKYYYAGYTVTDYYDEVSFNHDFTERSLYRSAERSSVSTAGSSTARSSIVLLPDGSSRKVERTFNQSYVLLKEVVVEFYPSGFIKAKITYEYDPIFGSLTSSEQINYDESENIIE